jgi:membrane protein
MLKYIENTAFVKWLKNTYVPGFKGVPLYFVISEFIKNLMNPIFVLRAKAMAYNFFFSLFPAFLCFFSLLPYIPWPDFKLTMIFLLESFLPKQGLELVEAIISNQLEKSGWGILSLSLVLTLFSATNGIITILDSFRRYDIQTKKKYNIVTKRLKAMAIFFMFFVILCFYVAIRAFGDDVLNSWLVSGLFNNENIQPLQNVFHFLLNFLFLIGTVALIFFVAPLEHKFKFLSPGSIVTAVLMSIANVILRIFFQSFNELGMVYGSAAAVIVLMWWFYWISIILLLGYEINNSIEIAMKKQNNEV